MKYSKQEFCPNSHLSLISENKRYSGIFKIMLKYTDTNYLFTKEI